MLAHTRLQQMQDFSAGSMRTINADNHHDYLALNRQKLHSMGPVIKDLLKPGQDFSKTQQLVDILDDVLKPGLDDVEKYVFALHLHHLLDVERFKFGGQIDVHHPLDFHNSTAEHSVSVLLMSLDMFCRTKDEMIRDNQQLQSLAEQMRAWFLRTVMHDTGELIMEFASFAEEQNAKDGEILDQSTDQIKLEAEISEFFTKLALYCYFDDRPDVYTAVLDNLRNEIVDTAKQRSKLGYTQTAQTIRNIFETFDFETEFPGFDDVLTKQAIDRRLHHFMDHYSHAEEFRGIGGRSVKIAQITDGNKTFVDHAIRGMELDKTGQETVVPYWLAQNRRILGAYDRGERHLVDVFQEAVDSETQKRIARTVAKENLSVLIEHICISPPVLDRRDKDRASAINVLPADPKTRALNSKRIEGLNQLIADEAAAAAKDNFRQSVSDVFARPTISARTQLLLYVCAFSDDADIINKHLFESPLVYLDEVPEQWKPFMAVLDHVLSHGLDVTDKSTISQLRGEFKQDEDPRYPDTISHIANNGENIMSFFALFEKHHMQDIPDYIARNKIDIDLQDLHRAYRAA